MAHLPHVDWCQHWAPALLPGVQRRRIFPTDVAVQQYITFVALNKVFSQPFDELESIPNLICSSPLVHIPLIRYPRGVCREWRAAPGPA